MLELQKDSIQVQVSAEAADLGVKERLAILHSNRANVLLSQRKYRGALDDSDAALIYNNEYVKALLRKASALCGLVEHGHHQIEQKRRAYSMAVGVLEKAQNLLQQERDKYATDQQQLDNLNTQQKILSKQIVECKEKARKVQEMSDNKESKVPDTKSGSIGQEEDSSDDDDLPDFLRDAGMDKDSQKQRRKAAREVAASAKGKSTFLNCCAKE